MVKAAKKKAAKASKAAKKLTVGVPASAVRALDRRTRELRGGRKAGWSRSDLVRLAIARLLGKEVGRNGVEALYSELHEMAGPLKLKAGEQLALGKPHLARPLYLQAASLELEALALLDDPDEETVRSALLEILILLKDGTGYRHLPDVPGGRRTVRSFQ